MKKSSILLASVMAGLLVIIPLGAYATTTIEYWNDMGIGEKWACLLYTSPSPRDRTRSRMPSSA